MLTRVQEKQGRAPEMFTSLSFSLSLNYWTKPEVSFSVVAFTNRICSSSTKSLKNAYRIITRHYILAFTEGSSTCISGFKLTDTFFNLIRQMFFCLFVFPAFLMHRSALLHFLRFRITYLKGIQDSH